MSRRIVFLIFLDSTTSKLDYPNLPVQNESVPFLSQFSSRLPKMCVSGVLSGVMHPWDRLLDVANRGSVCRLM